MSSTLFGFILISTLICASPGPSMLFVIAHGLSTNRKLACTAVFSITIANIIWVLLSLTGLAALMYSSLIAFEIIRCTGAFYLIYLGIQFWRKGLTVESNKGKYSSLFSVFFKGLGTSLSNPKALIFYISFLPQFVNTSEPFINQMILLGITNILVVFSVMSFYAIMAHGVIKLFGHNLFSNLFGKAIGGVLILSGVSLLKLKRAVTP